MTQEAGRVFAEVKPKNVRKLYIPKMNKEEQEIIVNAVNKMIEANGILDEQQDTIDELLFGFYELTEDEIKKVEEECNG